MLTLDGVRAIFIAILAITFGIGYWIAPWMLRATNNPPEIQALPIGALRLLNGIALAIAISLGLMGGLPGLFFLIFANR